MIKSLYEWCIENNNADLIKEWDKSNERLINEVPRGSHYNASWICPDGHKYSCPVKDRTGKNRGCPICKRRTHTSFPEQAVFFYIKKMFDDAINGDRKTLGNKMELDIYIPSLKTAIEYDGSYFHRTSNKVLKDAEKYQLCNKMGIKLIRIKQGLRKGISQFIIDCDYKITIIKDDSYSLNYAIQQLSIYLGEMIFPDVKKDELEIYNYLSSLNIKNFKTEYPNIAKEWDYEKNEGLRPEMFSPVASNSVFWKCEKGHSFKQKISNRVNGNSCPYCSGRYAIYGENDFATLYPNLLKEWDYEKNDKLGLNPKEILPRSDKEAFWNCLECGNNWKAAVKTRTKGYGCPKCGNRARGKALSKKVYCFSIDGNLIKEYDSLHSASIDTGIASSRLCRACNKEGKAVINGMYWTYNNIFDMAE